MPILRWVIFGLLRCSCRGAQSRFSLIGVRFAADAALEGDGFELPVPLTEARDILVLVANLRSCRAQPAEAPPVSPGLRLRMSRAIFFIEALLRILQIDRGINALLAVRHGPAHPRLGKGRWPT
jgi:hypothetical protein